MSELARFNDEQTKLIKATIMSGQTDPTDNDLALFGMICQRMGLDPFSKQIYAIERKGRWTFQVSIDGLRAIAERTGVYAGSDEPLYDEGLDLFSFEESGRKIPKVCKVTVWKIAGGVRCPFVGIARYSESKQNTPNWSQMPAHMLAVRAEAHALRKAFPQVKQMEEYASVIEQEVAIVEEPLPAITPSGVITQAQVQRLWTIASAANTDPEVLKRYLMDNYGWESSKDITPDVYEELCASIEQGSFSRQ